MNDTKIKRGAKVWYIPDGWLPLRHKTSNSGLEGHEALVILNSTDQEAKIYMNIYFEDREPIENIELRVPPKRVKCFRLDRPQEIGGVELPRHLQYALEVLSDVEIVVQFGRMDVTQSNLAYMGVIGYSSG